MKQIYVTVTTVDGTVLVEKVSRPLKDGEDAFENSSELANEIAKDNGLSHEKVLVKYYHKFDDVVPDMLPQMPSMVITEEMKKIIRRNISSEDFRYVPMGFDEHGQWGYVDWKKVTRSVIDTINKNLEIISQRVEERNKREEILVGDYLEMPDGTRSRVTHCYDDRVQDGGGSGSFHLSDSGGASYSGGLNSAKPLDKIHLTDEVSQASFWIFSKGWWGANRGFYFDIDVRVWKIKSLPKKVFVKFDDWGFNYHTTVNGRLSDAKIEKSFVGKTFNIGDTLQVCKEVAIYY